MGGTLRALYLVLLLKPSKAVKPCKLRQAARSLGSNRLTSGRRDGQQPAKLTNLPSWLTNAAKPGFSPETEDLFAKKISLRSAGEVATLLKWGLCPRARVKSAKVPPTSYVYYPPTVLTDRPMHPSICLRLRVFFGSVSVCLSVCLTNSPSLSSSPCDAKYVRYPCQNTVCRV